MQKIKCNPSFIHPYTLLRIPLVSLTKLQGHLNINLFYAIQWKVEKKNPIIWKKYKEDKTPALRTLPASEICKVY